MIVITDSNIIFSALITPNGMVAGQKANCSFLHRVICLKK